MIALPPPVDVPVEASANSPSSAEHAGAESGLLETLGGMFSSSSPQPTTQKPSASVDHGGPISSNGNETLTAEQIAQLDALSSPIGDVPGDPAAAGVGDPAAAGMLAVLDNVAFTTEDVTDALTEFFAFLGERFGSDHWQLSERQGRMLGGPSAQLANAMWAKLREKLPDILTNWCETTPGATAFLMAFGIVVVPKVMKQVKLSRSADVREKDVQRETQQPEAAPAPRKSPQRATAPGGIPAAAGIIGGN